MSRLETEAKEKKKHKALGKASQPSKSRHAAKTSSTKVLPKHSKPAQTSSSEAPSTKISDEQTKFAHPTSTQVVQTAVPKRKRSHPQTSKDPTINTKNKDQQTQKAYHVSSLLSPDDDDNTVFSKKLKIRRGLDSSKLVYPSQ